MASEKKNTSPEKDDKLYYKNKVLSFLRASTSRSSYIKYMMIKCYDYFEGNNTNNPYRALSNVFNIEKKSTKGTQTLKMPTIFADLNHIKAKVRSLVGELDDMGFKYHVESINKEAKSRKLEMKVKMMAEMAMRPYFDYAAAETGIEIGMNEELPDNMEELEKMFKNKTYKDVSDLCMDACLKYSLQYWNYLLMRFQLFRDVIISGECHAETVVVNGFPQLKRHNPINVFFTINPNDDDLLSRTNAKGICYYSDINEVMNEFDLKENEIDEAIKLGMAGTAEPYLGILYNGIKYFEPFLEDKKHILVSKWKWTDTIEKAGVEITYADGRLEFRIIDTEKVDKNRIDKKYLGIPDDARFKVMRKKVSTLKKCTLLAGQLVVDYGEEDFLIRDTENISMALCPIVSYKPEYYNGSNTSEVAQLMKIQDIRNYYMTMLNLEVTKSGGKALAVDVSKLPKEWGATPQDKMGKVLHYWKGFGIIPYNSAEGEGLPGSNTIPIQNFDTGIGSALVSYVTLMQFLEAEMDKISGIGSARLGNIQSANQLKGVTELALSQSNTITKYLYRGFFEFESRLLTYHCQHIKMSWIYNPERFTPIIGDFYMEFLKQDVDITMDTHAARVIPEEISMDTLRNYLMMAVQANALPLDHALKLEIEAQTNIRQAVFDYIDQVQENREKEQEQKQVMQEQQLQAQQQMQQAQAEAQQQMMTQQEQAGMQKQKIKSVTDWQKKKMDVDSKKYIEQMKLMSEKQEPAI